MKANTNANNTKTPLMPYNPLLCSSDLRIKVMKEECFKTILDKKKGVVVVEDSRRFNALFPVSNDGALESQAREALAGVRWSQTAYPSIYALCVGNVTEALPSRQALLRELEVAREERLEDTLAEEFAGMLAREKEFNARFQGLKG